MCLYVFGHRTHGFEYLFALRGIFKFNAVILLEQYNQFKRVDRVESQPIAEKFAVVPNIFRLHSFEVQYLDQFVFKF